MNKALSARGATLVFLLAALLVPALAVPRLAGADERPVAGTRAPEAPATGAITLERIMGHPDWIGNPPENPYWSDDGRAVYFTRKRSGEIHRDLWRIDLESGDARRVADAELGKADAPGELSRDRRYKVYAREGDVYWKDLRTGEIRQLTRTAEIERAPRFMAGDRAITFLRGDTVLVRELESGLEYQPAEIVASDDPAEKEPPKGYLERHERELFALLRQREAEEDAARERERELRAADPTRVPPPFYLGDGIEIHQRSFSPAGDRLLLVIEDEKRDEGRNDRMPSYVTVDGYVAEREVRPKVGTAEPVAERLVLLDLEAHEQHRIDLASLPGITVDPLAELRAAAKARAEAEKTAEKVEDASQETANESGEKDPEDETAEGETETDEKTGKDSPRPVSVQGIRWNGDGTAAGIMIHSSDNKDRWLAVIERGSTELRPVHRLQDDEGWINWSFNDFGWLRDGRRLWYLSEESGWSQLYLYHLEDGSSRRLTDGDYVVDEVELDPEERYFYFAANRDHPGIYETHRVAVAGGPVERITRLGGINQARLSPAGDRLLISHSETTRPPELYLQDARSESAARSITDTTSAEFLALPWTVPEIVEVPSSRVERPIYSRLYLPSADAPAPPPGERRPAVVFIHGAGYLQNAHQGWSGYFREFMFHSLLNRQGWIVLDMDYRASAGYGRDWRTAIYRRMGTPEVEDLADGIDYLVERHGVDRERIGVYGGSYGGFLTFMAMFKRPELFACGAALRPVTDWAHYNHPYTSNILNTPDVDPEAYARSSPIEFAEGLERPLLIAAGMQDDNVFFQDTVRLVQRLIELEKEGFETAFYPLEPHGFREPSSWLDEYRRIFELFTHCLEK